MKLYHARFAPNPERVLMFLKEKGKADQLDMEELNIIENEHKTDAFREVSPLSQLPALKLDDGRCLTESRAICRYLEGLYPDPNLMGADDEEAAFIEMWDRRVEMMWLLPMAWWARHGHPAFTAIERARRTPAPSSWLAPPPTRRAASMSWEMPMQSDQGKIRLRVGGRPRAYALRLRGTKDIETR